MPVCDNNRLCFSIIPYILRMETAEYSPQLADLAGTGAADTNAVSAQEEEPVPMQVK